MRLGRLQNAKMHASSQISPILMGGTTSHRIHPGIPHGKREEEMFVRLADGFWSSHADTEEDTGFVLGVLHLTYLFALFGGT